MFDCIQGQIVFCDSSASFRASPGSHRIFEQVMAIMQVKPTDRSQWCVISKRASRQQEDEIKAALAAVGGQWQIPIRAPAGSVILWLSTVIHSAKASDKPTGKRKRQDTHHNLSEARLWRCVAYVAFVQLRHLRPEQREARWQAMENNWSLNHWCSKVWRSSWRPSHNEKLCAYLDRPDSWPHFDRNLVRGIIERERAELYDLGE